jgi:hypothetical protein
MVQTAITRTKIESSAYNNVLSLIDDRTKISDPRDSTGQRTFVYDSDPFSKSLSFSGMPYIILEFPTFEMSQQTGDGKHKKIMWKQKITVRTVKDGASGSSDNVGRADMFSICDALDLLFNTVSSRSLLLTLNMSFVDLKKVESQNDVIDQQAIYESVYELTYWTRIAVSA